jgi:DNA topoisomerase VI subunit B
MTEAKSSKDIASVVDEFKQAVNMTPQQLEAWLNTGESQEVGQKKQGDESESIGHESGREIVQLLRKHKKDYTEADHAQMQRVISYVHRHSAQRPSGDIEHTRWRYSLMNWGHDPLK